MKNATAKCLKPPFELVPGDVVEAVDHLGTRWQGVVELTALEHGMFWIQTFMGERKLLDAQEHRVWVLEQLSRPGHVR